VLLKTLYVLVFMHLQSRRILGIGVSANPNATWMTQQARNLVMDLADGPGLGVRFLVHDRDAKHCRSFDEVFTSEGIEIVLTPYRAPKANAHVERLIGGMRAGRSAGSRVGRRGKTPGAGPACVRTHHNSHRPHRGLNLRCPDDIGSPAPGAEPARPEAIERRDVLGGLIHEYHARAA